MTIYVTRVVVVFVTRGMVVVFVTRGMMVIIVRVMVVVVVTERGGMSGFKRSGGGEEFPDDFAPTGPFVVDVLEVGDFVLGGGVLGVLVGGGFLQY